MSRIGQVTVAVIASAVVCAGGAAAIGTVTGVSPLVLISSSSVTHEEELTVANPNASSAPDIAVAVAHVRPSSDQPKPSAEPSASSRPTTQPTKEAPATVPTTAPSVQPSNAATLPSVGSVKSSGDDEDESGDDHDGKQGSHHSEHESDEDDD